MGRVVNYYRGNRQLLLTNLSGDDVIDNGDLTTIEHPAVSGFGRIQLAFSFVALFACFIFLAVPAAQAQQTEYTLGPGDKVRVTVYGDDQMSGEFTVSDTGLLDLRFIGAVEAAGRTVGQLRQSIRERLMPDYLKNPRVAVEVMEFRPFFIRGEINNKSSYPYRPGMSVGQAVAVAGGYTNRADKDDIVIRRAGKKFQATEDTAVLPGDEIEVKERFF